MDEKVGFTLRVGDPVERETLAVEMDARVGVITIEGVRYSYALFKELGGGLFVNVGSSVILPEVFLKAVASARMKGKDMCRLRTAVFDQQVQYRPMENVVKRPVESGDYFVGHHEIMIPLVAAWLNVRAWMEGPCKKR